MYAKLENGYLRSAPKTVQWQGHTVNNPSADKLTELGYKPVVYTDMPTDAPSGQHYESGWEEGDKIVQTWTLTDDPVYPEPELSAEEALNIIMGGWYSDKRTSRAVAEAVGKPDSRNDR